MSVDEDYEVVSTHETLDEAKAAGHCLIRLMGGLPPGWALSILHEDDGEWELVKYQA